MLKLLAFLHFSVSHWFYSDSWNGGRSFSSPMCPPLDKMMIIYFSVFQHAANMFPLLWTVTRKLVSRWHQLLPKRWEIHTTWKTENKKKANSLENVLIRILQYPLALSNSLILCKFKTSYYGGVTMWIKDFQIYTRFIKRFN